MNKIPTMLWGQGKRNWRVQAKPPTYGRKEVERRRKQLERRGVVPT